MHVQDAYPENQESSRYLQIPRMAQYMPGKTWKITGTYRVPRMYQYMPGKKLESTRYTQAEVYSQVNFLIHKGQFVVQTGEKRKTNENHIRTMKNKQTKKYIHIFHVSTYNIGLELIRSTAAGTKYVSVFGITVWQSVSRR